MKLNILVIAIAILVCSCLADKPAENSVPNTIQNSNSSVISSDPNITPVEPQVQRPINTGQSEKAVKGSWELSKTIVREGFTATSIQAWLKYVIITDNKKDSAYVINVEDGMNFDSLAPPSPMYVTVSKNRLLIPSYKEQKVNIFRGNEIYPLECYTDLAGPTAVMAFTISHYMMLDKDNSRLVYKRDDIERFIGKRGSGKGELLNPTNFEAIDSTKFYILDNGNKRVQVFDDFGESLFEFGKEQNFQNITGITSDEKRIFVSDFDKGVIYVYSHDGNYLGLIDEHINNPSDLDMKGNVLFIANQNGPEIVMLIEGDPED